MENAMKNLIPLGSGILIGAAVMLLAAGQLSTAHTPCNDYEPPPTCQYVQVVNPYTGKLQQEYVCD